MNCSRIQDLLPDFSVGAVGNRSRQEIEVHLAACPPCRRELKILESVALLVEEHGAVEPPVGLFNGVRNRIEAGAAPQQRAAWWSFLFTTPARVAGMGLATASVALGLFLPVSPVANVQQGPDLPSITSNAPAGPGIASSDLGSSVRQHALTAAEGPLSDRVAWEAMAQLASQDGASQADPSDDGSSDDGSDPGVSGVE